MGAFGSSAYRRGFDFRPYATARCTGDHHFRVHAGERRIGRPDALANWWRAEDGVNHHQRLGHGQSSAVLEHGARLRVSGADVSTTKNRRGWSRPQARCPSVTLDGSDRMHLDLHVDSEEELMAEVDRLINLGACRVDWTYPDEPAFVVLDRHRGEPFLRGQRREGPSHGALVQGERPRPDISRPPVKTRPPAHGTPFALHRIPLPITFGLPSPLP